MFVAITIALVALCTPDALAQVSTTVTTPTTVVPISKVEYCYTDVANADGTYSDAKCNGAVDKTSCACQGAAWVAEHKKSPKLGWAGEVVVATTDNCAATGCWSFQIKSGPNRMWMFAASCDECKIVHGGSCTAYQS